MNPTIVHSLKTIFLAIIMMGCGFTRSSGQVSHPRLAKVNYASPAKLLPGEFHFEGFLGKRIDDCIARDIQQRDIEEIVAPFRSRTETRWWQTEFWGKWMLSATKAYRYTGDPALLAIMKKSVEEILLTQSKDGYIGNYSPADRLRQWDIWGSKYTLLGLIYYYDITGEKKVIEAARLLANNVMGLVGPGKANIVTTGNYRGMASSSILEPVILLYERTADTRYLDFAKYIVQQWETPEGPHLISKSIAGVPVSQRYTGMKEWWGWENGQKAYEMMSCYDGLLKMHQLTGEKSYLEAVALTAANIREDEVNIAGSGSAFECWYDGKKKQTVPAQRGMETCVTTTWQKLAYELHRATADPQFVEEIEKSTYNHLLGALMPQGDRFSMYSGLQGYRDPDGFHCNMQINCCMANGPRGLVLLPDLALMHSMQGVFVNLYSRGNGFVQLVKQKVELQITTEYPKDGEVTIAVKPTREEIFDVNLRIPSWSASTMIFVNDTKVGEKVVPGTYFKLSRTWKKDDHIRILLDLKGKVQELSDGSRKFLAVTWGPIVLAQDSRFNPRGVDGEIQVDELFLRDFKLEPETRPGAWISFKTNVKYGLGENPHQVEISLIDYASAGNGWDPSNRFRVWMPVVYNLSADLVPPRR